MIGYGTLRKINKRIKQAKKDKAGKNLSPVRRIERVYPLTNRRVCAMTFDDGPSAAMPSPQKMGSSQGLTETLTDILKAYDARGTFDIIGTTAENYPDKRGKLHTASWGGKKHDHYPDFGKDHLAGAVNQPQLVQNLIQSGQSLTNHGYHHILYGPINYIYRQRETYQNIVEVVDDLNRLHQTVKNNFDVDMKFARPPHYIDHIKDGCDAYDAYALMGYHYLAASFDGGGWQPTTGDYEQDVEAMVKPLERALQENPEALNGQIIFQKDGCNMSLQTPIVDALPRQLALLSQYGYEVVTVDELINLSPFEDYGEGMLHFESARALDRAGFIIGYKNNTFQPSRLLTMGELITMATPRTVYTKKREALLRGDLKDHLKRAIGIHVDHHIQYARQEGYLGRLGTIDTEAKVTLEALIDFVSAISKLRGNIEVTLSEPLGETYTRAEVLPILEQLLIEK